MSGRITIANPNGAGYRIPGCRASSLRLEWQQEQTVLFGTVGENPAACRRAFMAGRLRRQIFRQGK